MGTSVHHGLPPRQRKAHSAGRQTGGWNRPRRAWTSGLLRVPAASCGLSAASDFASPSATHLRISAEHSDRSQSYSGSYGLFRRRSHEAVGRRKSFCGSVFSIV
jgi:hypothetical protein